MQDPLEEIGALLARYSSDPGSSPQLMSLLPQIVSCFDASKSAIEIIEELKKHQSSPDARGERLKIKKREHILLQQTEQIFPLFH